MIFGFSSWFLFIYPFKQLQDIIENRMLFWIHYTKCPVILQLLGSISMKQIQQSTDCRTASEGFRRSQARVEWTAIEQFVSTLRSSLEFLHTHVMDVIKLQQFTYIHNFNEAEHPVLLQPFDLLLHILPLCFKRHDNSGDFCISTKTKVKHSLSLQILFLPVSAMIKQVHWFSRWPSAFHG